MEAWIHSLVNQFPLWGLFLAIAFFIYTLAKGADILVDESVVLSLRWGVPKLLIGATVVSLGTTLPEAAVSVSAAISGKPELALGNAVGSIICDTGLILGIATLIKPLPLDKTVLNRQGYIQLGAGILLVLACLPWSNLGNVFSSGGYLPQWVGFVFLILLALYIYMTIRWSIKGEGPDEVDVPIEKANTFVVVLKLLLGIAIVIISSKFLIPTVEVTADHLSIPKSVIAATLVAFGTSLPELITAITSVRKGHGEIALGNVIGADILNVFFVAGLSAAVTPAGLTAEPRFFQVLFPGMLFILITFRVAVWVSKHELKRWAGFLLLGAYIAISVISYLN